MEYSGLGWKRHDHPMNLVNQSNMPPQFATSNSKNLKLFDYQVQGITWLIHQERRSEIPSWFTQEGPRTWRDKITGSMFSSRPRPVKGGILADGTFDGVNVILDLYCCSYLTVCACVAACLVYNTDMGLGKSS